MLIRLTPNASITEATTTEDLIATICNARSFREASFEYGCCVLDAIAMYDRRCGGGQLGTWRGLDSLGPLTFMSACAKDDHLPQRSVVERLAGAVIAWMITQRHSPSFLFTAWVVIDRATRVTWVECSPLKDHRVQHPRAACEAGEFPSSSQGIVAAHVFLRSDEIWQAVRDGMLEASCEARRLLDGETP